MIAILLGISGRSRDQLFCGIVLPTRWLVLLTAVIAPLMGMCELLHVPYLLTFLTMGITISSTSDLADEINAALNRLTGLLCVVFFVIHGAAMDLKKIWVAGSVGVAYIMLRCKGKYCGIYFMANAHRDGPW